MIEPGNARTPEKADWILRFIAEIIDRILWSLAFVPLTIGLILPWLVEDGTLGALAAVMGIFFSLVAMVGLALSYTNGRSVGKRLMGTQVVLLDGTPPNWAYNFLLREFIVKTVVVGAVGGITGGIGTLVNYLWPLWDKDRQTLHDKMASTFVVKMQ